MAVNYMTPNTQSNTGSDGSPVYEYTETKSAGTNTDPVLVPAGAGLITGWIVALVISSGSGRVEYSTSSRASVEAGTANWKAWDAGNVSATADDILEPVTAVRGVRLTGTIILEVIAS